MIAFETLTDYQRMLTISAMIQQREGWPKSTVRERSTDPYDIIFRVDNHALIANIKYRRETWDKMMKYGFTFHNAGNMRDLYAMAQKLEMHAGIIMMGYDWTALWLLNEDIMSQTPKKFQPRNSRKGVEETEVITLSMDVNKPTGPRWKREYGYNT